MPSSPFLYQKTRHVRTETPPEYRDYRQYKPVLQKEFAHQCVYCRALDTLKGWEGFGVDHYRPQKRFPLLVTEYLNLFYACNRCNSRKRDVWPRTARSVEFVPNPCEHVMWEHLRYKGGQVEAASATGRWAVELLDLNGPDLIFARTAYLTLIEATRSKLASATRTLTAVQKKLAEATNAADRHRLDSLLKRADENVAKLRRALQLFMV